MRSGSGRTKLEPCQHSPRQWAKKNSTRPEERAGQARAGHYVTIIAVILYSSACLPCHAMLDMTFVRAILSPPPDGNELYLNSPADPPPLHPSRLSWSRWRKKMAQNCSSYGSRRSGPSFQEVYPSGAQDPTKNIGLFSKVLQ